jgi:hypothetical protein
MRRRKVQPLRNKLDLSDAKQVRLVKKRLRLSEDEFTQIVAKVGNSIGAISKEVALQRARQLPEPEQMRVEAVDASVSAVAIEATETTVSAGPDASIVASR